MTSQPHVIYSSLRRIRFKLYHSYNKHKVGSIALFCMRYICSFAQLLILFLDTTHQNLNLITEWTILMMVMIYLIAFNIISHWRVCTIVCRIKKRAIFHCAGKLPNKQIKKILKKGTSGIIYMRFLMHNRNAIVNKKS